MSKKTAKYRGFVPYTVDKALKVAVDKGLVSDDQALDLLLELVGSGCKVSIAWEEDNQAYHVFAFRVEVGKSDSGLILSCRHSDVLKAITMLGVLDKDVFGGEWKGPNEVSDQYNW